MNQAGKVVLVGAGPGDPGLLTLKGKEAIEQADVLVYDRLVSQQLLSYARASCELIYVGKTPDRHTLPQDQINELLVRKAKEGGLVVRLKGGDPFVFGRGGEEAAILREHGIRFEIVPGVTSAIAGPAYAGIPVTHRGVASSFSVITGHEDPEKFQSSLDWDVLAKMKGTLIFLMGMKNLPLIVDNLMTNGMAAKKPVAIVQRGTWPDQRVLCSTLDSVVKEVEAQGFSNPSIIVVGDVVVLQHALNWLDERPLAGKNVVVTRARSQASDLTRVLQELGAAVEEYPMIRILAPEDEESLESALSRLESFDTVIFSSANGVEAVFDSLDSAGKDSSAAQLSGKTVAVGPSTESALELHGVRNVVVPDRFDSDGVLSFLADDIKPGQRVLLLQAQQSRPALREGLRDLGADVEFVAAYRSVPVEEGRDRLAASLQEGVIHAMTFTSSSTVRNMVDFLDGDISLLEDVALYSIGPVTSQTMEEFGLPLAGQAEAATIDELANAISKDQGGLL